MQSVYVVISEKGLLLGVFATIESAQKEQAKWLPVSTRISHEPILN